MDTNTLTNEQGLALAKSIILDHYGDGDFSSLSGLPEDELEAALQSCGDPLLRYLLVECSTGEGCQDITEAAGRLHRLGEQILSLAARVDEAAGVQSMGGTEARNGSDLETVRSVRITKVSTTSRSYDAIVVVLADMHLSKDLTSDRDIRLASSLARSHGVDMDVSPELRERVKAALR